jgi:hypothetical protein
MELVTTAFKIVVDERYKEIKEKDVYLSRIKEIVAEFKVNACLSTTLLECYNIFSTILVKYWEELGEEIAGRIFDLLFREWDLVPKIVARTKSKKSKNDYYYSLEEDL